MDQSYLNTEDEKLTINSEPLASKFRPDQLDGFIGQKHLVGEEGPIKKFIQQGSIPSMIFWGPPGCGKTTLAYIISKDLRYDFYKMQAVSSGKSKLMEIIKISRQNEQYDRRTVLFLDEIHRWNKAQQDALLPYVEKGLITLIGATTENPSFTINNALLSRTKVFIFNQLTQEEIFEKLNEIINKQDRIEIDDELLNQISLMANGDMRSAYNILEMSLTIANPGDGKKVKITEEMVLNAVAKSNFHDRDGEDHYNIISAIHKSLRSSNGGAAVYWIVRMLEGGEDPLYIARRLLRFASEDIGNADPNAVVLANAVFETCQKLGMPECDVHLVQLAKYLADAPKDNSAYIAGKMAREDSRKYGNLQVPLHIRNAPTKLMSEAGYGKGYEYDHDLPSKKSDQECFPEKLKGRKYFKDDKKIVK